jgi:hypothetical protein
MIAAVSSPAHFGKTSTRSGDCMTDLVHKSGPQPASIVVLEQIHAKFDKEAREQPLDISGMPLTTGRIGKIPFRCFYFL